MVRMRRGREVGRGSSGSSDFSDCSDIVGTPGVIPFMWEEQPGRPKGPAEAIFESVLAKAVSQQRESSMPRMESTASMQRAPRVKVDSSSSEEDRRPARVMKLNLRSSLMGVHILDDETELFFSRQVSNASSNTNSNGTPFRSAGAVPFKWEVEPGKPFEATAKPAPRVGPLLPPPGSRPNSGLLYSGPLGLGPDTMPNHYGGAGPHLSDKLFKKLVGQSRGTNATPTTQGDHLKILRKRGESSTETLDRHFGHYDYNLKYEDESVSPTSTLDHDSTESSPSSTERFHNARHRQFQPVIGDTAVTRPSSQLAQCLLSLTAMADESTDEDDIIFNKPNTTTPWQSQELLPVPEPQRHWPMVQYSQPNMNPRHGHRQIYSPTRMSNERWSSTSSSWNLSLIQKPNVTVTNVVTTSSTKQEAPGQPSRMSNGAILREIHAREIHAAGRANSSAVLTYDRSGDVYGRHKWERESSGSLPSVDELGFEAYNRPEEVMHTVDEEDFPFSPIASSFVFGERNNGVEFSQRGRGFPKSVGPIVQEFSSPPEFDMHEYRDSLSNTSEETSLTSPLEGSILPDHQWIPTKSFHYIKGHGVEIHELGCSSRVFSGYLEVNRSGRFSIDLQRGPRLERHRSARAPKIDKTPEVLLRLVKDANSMSQKKRPSSKHGCFSQCKCLPVPKKGFLGRCLTSNQRPTLAMGNSFEGRLGSRSLGSRSLGSVGEKNPTGPFQFF